MKNLIVGLGKSGRGAALLLLTKKEEVFGYDDRLDSLRKEEEIRQLEKEGLQLCSPDSLGRLSTYDRLVISPGVSLSHPLIQEAKKKGLLIIGELQLGLEHVLGKCLAVTGSNGKTTVTLLTASVLKEKGMKAEALGNVGVCLSGYLAKNPSPEICVVEISSFQLEILQGQFFDAACLINITPDHMDRYPDMQHYAKAKLRLQECLKEGGKLYLPLPLFQEYAPFLQKEKISCFDEREEDGLFQRLKGRSPFNERSNLLSSYHLASHVGSSEKEFAFAYEKFQKPAHRMEFVAEINGISFYNDSKATNVESVLYAVQAIEKPILLIAGGYDKGLEYHAWKSAFRGRVKEVALIGDCREKIARALQGISVKKMESLQEAVEQSYRLAKKGDAVLLSPGCSSYDMFKNYEHRGDEFKRIVHCLEREEKFHES
jgi:UDP-N-acetylmuramoylalanine--D-glutamate ligase